ncbi:MAG: glycyl-radical enzyme activating protein [Candidatus Hermodarchaeota archaeon]
MTDQTFIVDIKRNALDDGPGIRTLIFFKGCPLSCVWCQNPEATSPLLEISFDKELCSECRNCATLCNQDAIDFENEFRINRDKCDLCGNCIKICPNTALELVGKEYTIAELMEIIMKDKIFYENSGGGVTLTGGEPLYHIKYVHNLLKELKKVQVHTCIETCGFYNRNEFEKLVMPYVDLIYFDLKIFNPNKHIEYCKVVNTQIKENFENLIIAGKVQVLPRIPLIPNITDTDENLTQFVAYLRSLKIKKVALLPYNPLWLFKLEKLGKKTSYSHGDWLPNKEKERIKSHFKDFEFNDF